MRIVASSCCWWHHTLEEGIKLAAEAGFTAYEPLMFPEEIFPLHGDLRKVSADQITRLLGDHGLTLAALHIAAIWTGPKHYRPCVEYARLAIDVAGRTGCNLVVAGGPNRADQRFVPFLEALEELEPLLRGTPVRLALENHHRNWIESIADYEHIFDYIDSPNIGITLDTGHFTAAGIDPEVVARRFGSTRVFHVHIKDHQGAKSVPLGTGQTNNFGTVRVLGELGYQGHLSQEIECGRGRAADQAAADGITYMRQLQQAGLAARPRT